MEHALCTPFLVEDCMSRPIASMLPVDICPRLHYRSHIGTDFQRVESRILPFCNMRNDLGYSFFVRLDIAGAFTAIASK